MWPAIAAGGAYLAAQAAQNRADKGSAPPGFERADIWHLLDEGTRNQIWSKYQANQRVEADADIKRQEDFQREFAQMGIRWRVADARAAGLHPLAALGTSGASGSPVMRVVPDGQDVRGPVARQQTGMERMLTALQLYGLLASAQKDFAEASYYASEAKRRSQDGAAAAPLQLPVAGSLRTGPSATAQKVQDEYGDIVENVYGLIRLTDDVASQMLGERTGKRLGAIGVRRQDMWRRALSRRRPVYGTSSGE